MPDNRSSKEAIKTRVEAIEKVVRIMCENDDLVAAEGVMALLIAAAHLHRDLVVKNIATKDKTSGLAYALQSAIIVSAELFPDERTRSDG